VFTLDAVSYAYPQCAPVISDLTMTINKGERISILGANGCGKSTLLKMLAGLIFPDKGSLMVFGNSIDKTSITGDKAAAYHRRVGFIFQDSEIQLFCSNVYEELAFGPLQLGLSEPVIRNAVKTISHELNIEKLLDKPPFQLSGGEKKKIALASILILDPEVLILDEPTNNLDPRSQSWLLQILQQLADNGKTLILATHNLDLAPHITDRAVLFAEDHTVAADLPIRELLQNTKLLQEVNLVDDHFHIHSWDFE
jgi:cobalt/nickel transport system ATP-binding protein